jgi:hypothetical protein
MRLAFCFISNQQEKLKELHDNFIYDIYHESNRCVSSFTVNVLTNPPISRAFYLGDWNFKWISIKSRNATDFFSLRQESIKMTLWADIIFIGEDDMKFLPGSTEVINQCVDFMRLNPQCGAIYLGGNFGGEGAMHDDEFYIANSGSLGTNRGIMLRNRPELLDNSLHALGACEDAIMGFTALMQGYWIARRLNIQSIIHENTHRISEDTPDINYSLPFIRNEGLRYSVGKIIGPWESRTEWPPNIFAHYRRACIVRGFTPRYTYEGEIE